MDQTYAYAYWKILAWRFVRSGIAGGVSTLATISVVLQPNLSNWKIYLTSIIAGFIGGFITALAKALRDYFSEGNQTSLIQKLPI